MLDTIKVGDNAFASSSSYTDGAAGFIYFSDLPSLHCLLIGDESFSLLSHVDFRSG